MDCPLCRIDERKEKIRLVTRDIMVVDTITPKGHRGRIMCLYRKHTKKLAPLVRRRVMAEFRNFCIPYFFSYTDRFSIHKDTFSTIPGHWHIVASDLDRKAEDYRQILKTPRTEYRLKTRDVEV